MPKVMVIRMIMCLGAVLLSTAPISQTFAQVKQQEAQTSEIAVADTLSNSSATESDNLQLLRPDATIIFPKSDSIPVVDSVAVQASAGLSTGDAVFLVLVIVLVIVVILAISLSNMEPLTCC